MSKSTAIVGRVTVVKPLSSVLIPVIRVTDAITIVVVALDVVVVGALSRPRKVTSSLRALLATVDGRRVLGVGVLAKTACGTCGTAIEFNSIEVRDMFEEAEQVTQYLTMGTKIERQLWRPLGTRSGGTPGIPVACQGQG